jgi:glycosyltransferase involved in cell wall biosynthesis
MAAPRILMFCPQFRPVIGGAERQAERLAVALSGAGCRVTIVTPRIDPDSPDVEEVQGVRIERFPMADPARRWPVHGIALLNIPFILWQVVCAIWPRLRQADLLHTHLASLQTLGAVLAARLAGKPALCKAAMADQRSDLGELEKQGFAGRLVALLIRRTLRCWVATTQAVAQALINAGVRPSRIVQIPNGIELGVKPRDRSGPVRRFLYLGRLSTNTQRDVPTLIRAFETLARGLPDAELALVGGGDLLEATRSLAAACEARQRIHVPGFDTPDHWLEWADCFVLPSRREGLSNALLEAMAAGLPCIANDIPPNREVLADGEAGVLVPVDDIGQLFEAMQRMATDAGHADTMRAAARLRVTQHYGIEAVAGRYLGLYRQLIDKYKVNQA